MIAIVSCGKKKSSVARPAFLLYEGSYFRLNIAYARKLTGDLKRVYILSAKYGLVRAFEKLEPYDLKMGQDGCVTSVKEQAIDLGIEKEKEVIVLGGKLYSDVCKGVWPHCETPLQGIGGIGKQLRYLKTML